MKQTQFLFWAFLTLTAIGVSVPAFAQTLQYNNDGERLGACTGPQIRLMAFEKILAYTRNNFPVDAPVFEEAVVSWKTRNSDYLKFSKRLIEADKKIARSPSFDKETRDSCRQIVEVLIPNGADRFANTLIGSINDLKPVSTAENLLIDFIDSIKKGKWDVAVRDPELAGFMDVKIKELKSESQW